MWPTSCQERNYLGKKEHSTCVDLPHFYPSFLYIKNKLNSAKKRETEVQNTILFLFPFVPSGYKRKVDQKQESFFLLLRFCGNRNIFSPSFPPTWVKMIFLGNSQITSGKKMLKMLTHIFFSSTTLHFPHWNVRKIHRESNMTHRNQKPKETSCCCCCCCQKVTQWK